jgi:predicted amidohydrolase
MKELSKRYHIYLGTTIVEVEGTEFYNTFLLTDPEGELVGKYAHSDNSPLRFFQQLEFSK